MQEGALSRYVAFGIACLAAIALAVYVTGYFLLCVEFSPASESVATFSPPIQVRGYSTEWQANLFYPLSQAESALTGLDVWSVKVPAEPKD